MKSLVILQKAAEGGYDEVEVLSSKGDLVKTAANRLSRMHRQDREVFVMFVISCDGTTFFPFLLARNILFYVPHRSSSPNPYQPICPDFRESWI